MLKNLDLLFFDISCIPLDLWRKSGGFNKSGINNLNGYVGPAGIISLVHATAAIG